MRLQVVLGRLNGSTNLSGIFRAFHNEFSQSSVSYRFFFLFTSLLSYTPLENIEGFAKELRKTKKEKECTLEGLTEAHVS